MLQDCTGGQAPRTGDVQTATLRLAYLEWGSGNRPLVLLHGITSSAATLWRTGPAFAAQGYHVYAFDLPGHGTSEATSDHRIETIAALVQEAIGLLGLGETVLIGHSWGGAIALTLAATSSVGLTNVVLLDPAMQMEPTRGAQALPSFLEGVGLPPEETLPTLRAKNPDWHPCDAEHKADALVQCRVDAVEGLFLNSGTWDRTALLGQVDVPLLLLVADLQHTVIAPEVLAAAEHSLRPGLGQMQIVPGTNHNMLRGGFNQTMQAMTQWLQSNVIL